MNETETGTNETVNIITDSSSSWIYTGIAIYMTVIGLLCVVGNTGAIITIRKLQLTCKPFIINLAVADLIEGAIGFPLAAYSSFMNTWQFGPAGCTWYGYICFSCSVVSIFTHCGVAFHRFYHVCKNNSGSIFHGTVGCYITIGVTWWVSIAWCSLPLIGFGSYGFESFGTACSLNWRDDNRTNMIYIKSTFVMVLLLPIFIVVIMYIRIVKYTRMTIQSVDTSVSIQRTNNSLKIQINNRLFKVLSCSMTAFAAVWFPYGVISIIRTAGFDVPIGLVVFLTMLAKLQCAMNPLIYIFSSSSWYKKIKELVQIQPPTPSSSYELS